MIRAARPASHLSQLAGRSKLSVKFALSMLMVSLSLSVLPSRSAILKSPVTKIGATQGVISLPETAAEKDDERPNTGHRVYAPHWSTENGFATTIYIRNVQIKKAITARLSLVLDRRTIKLSPTRIDALQTVAINLSQALVKKGEASEQSGGAVIDFEGESTGAVNAYAQVLDINRSLGFSFPFMPGASTVSSQRLEAVAWYYSGNTNGFLALQNTSEKATKVVLTMFVSGQEVSLGKKNLKPQQVLTIKLPSLASLGYGSDVQSAGLGVEYSGSPGSVVAQGWMMDAKIGFSFPFAFHYPSNCNCSGDTQHLYGTGIMIGAAMSDVGPIFSPYFTARNSSEKPLIIIPIFSYVAKDRTEKVSLPLLILNAQETAVVNLRKYQEDGRIPLSVTAGNIDLQYQGESGALVAEMASVDQNGTFVPPVPLVCNGNRALHMSFWRTDGDWHSSVTLQNIATEENEVEITISYPGGTYLLEKTIAAGGATMVSINELQQLQTSDREGRRIPAGATFGGLNIWSRNINNGLVINAMTMNPVTKTCGSCGGTGYVNWYNLTDTYGCTSGFGTYAVGDYVNLMMSIHWSTSNCSYENPQLNSSSNNSVVNMSLQAVGAGDTNLQASSYQSYPRDISCSSYYHLTSTSGVSVIPNVTISFTASGVPLSNGTPPPGSPNYVNTATMTAQGNPSGGNYVWQALNQNKATISGSTTSQTLTILAVATSSSPNDAAFKVQYTVSGKTGSSTKFITVQQPTSMGFVSVNYDRANNCSAFPGTAGREKGITWQLKDQFGQDIAFSLPTYDTMNPQQNGCNLTLSGTSPSDPNAHTGPTGLWSHRYWFCTTFCASGTCQTTGYQRYSSNGFLIDLPFTFQCNGITVNGH
jgi:hypothetical protein